MSHSVPRRDLILLPLIFVSTLLVCVLAAEGVARVVWPEHTVDQCMRQAENGQPKPNCMGLSKAAEGPWVENRYNQCGFRATGPCAPASLGTARIAVVGSSTSFGYLVPFDRVWSVVAARQITQQCGTPVDVQSLVEIPKGRKGFGNLNDTALHLPLIVAMRPNLVVLLITPFDLFDMPEFGFDPDKARQTPISGEPPPEGLFGLAKAVLSDSRAFTFVQHHLYNNVPFYISTYLHYGDRADFIRAPLSAAWQVRVEYFDRAIAYLAGRLRSEGVPLLVAFAPQQAQAYIIATGFRSPGLDPEVLEEALKASAERHGVGFADGASAFARVPEPQDDFYHTDGHLNASGQERLGHAVAGAILDDIPSLCRRAEQRAAANAR